MEPGSMTPAEIEVQMSIFEEFERQERWDELARIGVLAPFFVDDDTPRAAAARFATGFLRSLSD